MRCPQCRKEQKEKDEQEQRVMVGQRSPAAMITTEDGQTVMVDKFGKEVDNPGYDLKNDPRGWTFSGTRPKKRETIL